VLTRPDTVIQADDVVYAAAVSGTVASVTQAAQTAPVERG
jgi:trk system potassium uptake protein TrkA